MRLLTAAAAALLAVFSGAALGNVELGPRAAEPELRFLSRGNWTEHISKGAWFINFCAATSKFCSEFEPVWAELQKEKEPLSSLYPAAPFALAKVDCLADPGFCGDEGVDSIPYFNLYVDGTRKKERYQGLREYVQLSDWIEAHARNYRKTKGVKDIASTQPTSSAPVAAASSKSAPASSPEQAPAPAPAPPPPAPAAPKLAPVAGPQGPNSEGKLLSFGKPPIKDLVALNGYLGEHAGQGASFVKFYAPWCPHCRAMARTWEHLASELKGRVNVIEVNCESFMDTCRRYSVTQFPTLKMFNDGEVTEYLGGRNLDAMRSWALKAGATSGVQEIEKERELEDIVQRNEVVFLYLVEPGVPKQETHLVERASRALLTTRAQFLQSSSPDLLRRFGNYLLANNPEAKASDTAASHARSAVLVFKDRSFDRPVKAFYPGRIAYALSGGAAAGTSNLQTDVNARISQQISEWLNANRYPTLSEITGTNFGDVIHNKQSALVVLGALSDIHHGGVVAGTGSGAHLRDAEERALRDLARRWRLEQETLASGTDGEVSDAAIKSKSKKGKGKSRKIIWAWIDADRWAKALREYYGVHPQQLPALILVDGSRLQYYPLPTVTHATDDKSWLNVPALATSNKASHPVFESIYAALRGEIKARSSRTYVDRSVRGAEEAMSSVVDWTARHWLLSFVFVLGILALLVSYVRAVEGGGAPSAGSWARRLAGGQGSSGVNGNAALPHYHAGTKAD